MDIRLVRNPHPHKNTGRQIDLVDLKYRHASRIRANGYRAGMPTVHVVHDLPTYDTYTDCSDEHPLFPGDLVFFDSLMSGRHHRSATVLLFPVGVTEFAEKLTKEPFSRYVPEFKGGDNADGVVAYIIAEHARVAGLRWRFRVRVCDLHDVRSLDFLFAAVGHGMRQKGIRELQRGEWAWKTMGWVSRVLIRLEQSATIQRS